MSLLDEMYVGGTDIKMVVTGYDYDKKAPILRDEHGKKWVIDEKYLTPTGVTGVHVVIWENIAKQLGINLRKLMQCVMDMDLCISSITTFNDTEAALDYGDMICKELIKIHDDIHYTLGLSTEEEDDDDEEDSDNWVPFIECELRGP